MQFDLSTVLFAFTLTLLAGLATGIGSLIAFVAKRTNTRFLCLALGFSAGVMLYVSFVANIVKARVALTSHDGHDLGNWVTVLAFFGGIALIAAIDKLVPSNDNPHEVRLIEEMEDCLNKPELMGTAACISEEGLSSLQRTGIFTALAIGIHNFPEGLATFTMALNEPATGIAIAVAIAIHNIPEGIAVSVPIYYATGDRRKAFLLSFLSGLAEPVGALVGFLLLMPLFSAGVFGILFAGVAGIMG